MGEQVGDDLVLVRGIAEIEAGARRHAHLNLLALEGDAALLVAADGGVAIVVILVGDIGDGLHAVNALGADGHFLGERDASPRVGDEHGDGHVGVKDLLVDVEGDGPIVRAIQAVDADSVGFASGSPGTKLEKKGIISISRSLTTL